jgi:hypothetical protein
MVDPQVELLVSNLVDNLVERKDCWLGIVLVERMVVVLVVKKVGLKENY